VIDKLEKGKTISPTLSNAMMVDERGIDFSCIENIGNVRETSPCKG